MDRNRMHAKFLWGLLLLLWPTLSHAAGPLAIQNAKIITVSGETIENGVVIIRDGKIDSVGKDINIPGEALIIDGTGKVVMPGIIDAHSADGMSQANERNALVPFLSVVDSIDPNASYFEECRRNGITTAAVVPGNSTLIGGKAAIVKTAGQYVNDMLVRRDSALKLSLRPVSGSRMSQMSQLRKEFDKAKRALEKESEESGKKESQEESKSEDSESEDDEPDPEDESDANDEDDSDPSADADDDSQPSAEDEGLEVLKLALQGKLPVYIYCEFAMDVVAAKQLAKDYELDTVLVLGRDCYKAAEVLAELEKTVILDPTLVFWETDSRSREDKKVVLPEIYNKAGVPFIFQVGSASTRGTVGNSYFWYQAATAVKFGVSTDVALAAITLEPAKLLGIDSMVGSIEVGKDADLIVLTGEPLDIATWVEYTIVGGEVVYDRAEDEKLERLLTPVAE